MTMERTATHLAVDPPGARDFDYGVGDEARQLEERVRQEIAERIRRTARADALAGWPEKQAYERAAQIAEGRV